MLESKSPAASACPRSEAYRYRTEGSNQTRSEPRGAKPRGPENLVFPVYAGSRNPPEPAELSVIKSASKRTPAVSDRTKPEGHEDFSPGPPAFPPPCLARTRVTAGHEPSPGESHCWHGVAHLADPNRLSNGLNSGCQEAFGTFRSLLCRIPGPAGAEPGSESLTREIRRSAQPWPDRP